jgi:hypothetical protein
MRKIALVSAILSVITGTVIYGYLALAGNMTGAHLPLGPVGNAACRDAVNTAKANIPDVIAEAQSNVDSVVASDPNLAPYAAGAKQAIANAAPGAAASLDDAGHSLGC